MKWITISAMLLGLGAKASFGLSEWSCTAPTGGYGDYKRLLLEEKSTGQWDLNWEYKYAQSSHPAFKRDIGKNLECKRSLNNKTVISCISRSSDPFDKVQLRAELVTEAGVNPVQGNDYKREKLIVKLVSPRFVSTAPELRVASDIDKIGMDYVHIQFGLHFCE